MAVGTVNIRIPQTCAPDALLVMQAHLPVMSQYCTATYTPIAPLTEQGHIPVTACYPAVVYMLVTPQSVNHTMAAVHSHTFIIQRFNAIRDKTGRGKGAQGSTWGPTGAPMVDPMFTRAFHMLRERECVGGDMGATPPGGTTCTVVSRRAPSPPASPSLPLPFSMAGLELRYSDAMPVLAAAAVAAAVDASISIAEVIGEVVVS